MSEFITRKICNIVAKIQALRRRKFIPRAVTNKQAAMRIEATSLETMYVGLI